MDYSKCSRNELIDKIEELKSFNEILLNERMSDDKLEFAWSGNLGHWYFNIVTGQVIFNPLKVEALGFKMEELPDFVHYSFFTDRLHPDDYKPTMDSMIGNMKGETPVYECEYRIQCKNGQYKWFYDRGKVVKRSAEGKPLYAAGIVFDITERKNRIEHLEMENLFLTIESMTDALTGIRNHGAIIDELQARMEHSSIYKTPLSILMFDIDYFKTINDSKGHVYGDTVLKQIAVLISQEIRGLDTVGRYGGEEFLVILPNTPLKSALFVAERIRLRIENHQFSDDLSVTISGGAAELQEEPINEFISKADRKLYESKHAGRNRISW